MFSSGLAVLLLSVGAGLAARFSDMRPKLPEVVLQCDDEDEHQVPSKISLFRRVGLGRKTSMCNADGQAPSPFSDMRAWFTKDTELTRFYWDERNITLGREHIAQAAAPYGLTGARLRWRKALDRLLHGERLKVVVLGGSMTTGSGSPEPWSKRFETLARQLGYKMTVTNLARGATSSMWLKHNWMQMVPDLKGADMILVDYSVNDGATAYNYKGSGGEVVAQSFKTVLAKMLYTLPKAPAVVNLETFNWDETGFHKAIDCVPYHAQGPHWQVLRDFEVPTVSYTEAVCAAWGKSHWFKLHTDKDLVIQREDAVNVDPVQLRNSNRHPHPGIVTHDLVARVLLGAFIQEMDEVCQHGVTGKEHPPLRRGLENLERPSAGCLMSPSTELRAEKGEAGFRAAARDDKVWRFYEEVKGKPGWIAAGDGVEGNISFDVTIKGGWIQAEFLGTYENIGSLVCWLDGEEPVPGTNECRMDGLWAGRFSMPKFMAMRTPHQEGNHVLRCRSDGKKFKITSITAC